VDPITQSEYYTQCQAIAVECVREAAGDRDAAYEAVRESVDSHQWLIYTYYNLQILTHSRNEDAYFDENGGTLNTESFADTMTQLAHYAMHADVCEYVETALTEYRETEAV
jgi:hypothetical protein